MLAVVVLFTLTIQAFAQSAAEWPQWRGANRDGISKETGLLKQWPADGPPLFGRRVVQEDGYSTFSISKGRMYTMGLRGDREFIVAFDAATGKEVWATPHGSAFRNDRGDGPRGTPTIDGDRIYALGGNGDLSAIEAKTGKTRLVKECSERVWRLQHSVGY